jgi:hypothetical protein
MTTDLEDLYYLAQGLMDFYADRNKLFLNIDKMMRREWNMPKGMPDWVMKVVSTDPSDTILTTVRTFATVEPRFKVMPMLPDENNRKRANEIETAIKYNFKQAGRRNDSTVTWDVMTSAARYAEVAAQVIYLPYQEKILRAMGKDTRRIEAAKRFGDFSFIIHNPANIYPEWSEYGLEGVLCVRVQTADEFIDTWGELAKPVISNEDYNEGRVSYVTSYDYINYEKRCVWGIYSDTGDLQLKGRGVIIMEEENKLGFIPYAIKRWGNSLSLNPNERVMPLLQSIYDSGQWDMLNVFSSLDASLALKRAAQAQFAAQVPPGQDIEIDNTEPAGVVKLPQGTQGFTPLPSQSVDQRVMMQKTEIRSGIWQSTVARVLQTLEFPSGTAYSSVNQILSTAVNSLSPYKMLGQNALAEVAHLMLCWIKYYGKEYGKVDLYGQYDTKEKLGQEVRISSETIDPDALQIEVLLTDDIPTDKLQSINGAVLLKQNFRIPEADLIEDLVGGDPQELDKRRALEDYKNAYIAADIQRIQMAPQLEAQQMQQEQQMQMQSQQMQQEMAARQQEQAQASAQDNGSPATDNTKGQGWNPNMGGTPPVGAARGQR